MVKMAHLLVDLARRKGPAPRVQQFREHADGPEQRDFAREAELRQLLVRHAHVGLVGLRGDGGAEGPQFGGRRRGYEGV